MANEIERHTATKNRIEHLIEDLERARSLGGTQGNAVSARMRCKVRWPIRLMAGLLST